VQELADRCRDDRNLTSVAELARGAGLSRRRLQRLFADRVGVGPKWALRRYRLHEAVARMDAPPDGAALAAELGYCDQAHFVRDFKAAVGAFAAELRRTKAGDRGR